LRTFLILCLIFSFLVGCKKEQILPTNSSSNVIPWSDSSSSHPKAAALRALIEKYRVKGLPGISLLVRDAAGTWVGSTGKADVENDIDFGVSQVSKVASITKLFMGTMIFKMIEDSASSGIGYLALHKPITTWIPSRITDRLPNGNKITLGDCMKHETGIPDLIEENSFYLEVLNNPNKVWEAEDLLAYIYDQDPLFAPNDTAVYSNTNTILVTLVAEYATGRKHSDLLKQYITGPLGLTNTYYQPHDQLPGNVAQGYYDLYDNGTIVNLSNWVTGAGSGYGGIYSNIFDLYTFFDALMLSRNLLSEKSLNMMMMFGKPDGSNRYGYGIMQKFIERGINAGIGHSGRDLAYTANLFYFPNRQVTHVFLVNYGTDAKTSLKQVFLDFQNELMDLTLN